MADKQVKGLNSAPMVTQMGDRSAFLVDPQGSAARISKSNLRSEILDGVSTDAIFDNVFILYHAASGDYPRFVKPHKWGVLQSGGEIASGVMINEGLVNMTDATANATLTRGQWYRTGNTVKVKST